MRELPDFDSMWDYDKPTDTEKRFAELLPLAQESGDVSYHAQLLTQIARTQGLQRKFDEAHHTLDEALSAIGDDSGRAKIRYLLERGRVFNSSKQPDQARPLFLQAWESACAQGEDFYAVDAAHMLAIVAPTEHQLEWNVKALAIAENSKDLRAQNWLGSLYNNIGWTYHDSGQYEKALEVFQKALQWREEQGKVKPIRIAKWCVGRTLRSLGRISQAHEIQRALLEEHERVGEHDGYVYEELAECALLLGESDEAEKFFALAYAELSQDVWLVEREPERIERLKALGRVS
jgi:tetratricopeptide (TPR) repeat protein